MTERTGYPAYHWRYLQPIVAWFCSEVEAKSFLDTGEDFGSLAADGSEPRPGVDYEDKGHLFCFAANCPDDDEVAEGGKGMP